MNLRATSLVSATRQGREQFYQLEPQALGAVLAPWIAKYERYWSDALVRLRDAAEKGAAEERVSRRKPRRKRAK
jgi:hypothetical protein